eukprot:TRINITY_DN894_c0_g1_i1.p1 TRINITY_DN894_c0_g1~~TRINITY_DN894_c0_g1_i1.p1  ORF type:complete len:187 (-),score=36.42 TRINITY_DN894_c0_g1_i1:180-740(-)
MNGSQHDSQPSLCRNGCGFYGNASFDNYCSKCYNTVVKPKLQGQAPPAASAPISIRPAASAGAPSVRVESSAALNSTSPSQAIPANQNGSASGTSPAAGSFGTSPLATSPASGSPSSPFSKGRSCGHADCKKKLPLTAVACRCGNMYCSTHRYAEAHQCTFDYKTRQQEMLKEANPTVVHSKLESI